MVGHTYHLTLWKLRQEDYKFEANLCYTVSPYLRKKERWGGGGRQEGPTEHHPPFFPCSLDLPPRLVTAAPFVNAQLCHPAPPSHTAAVALIPLCQGLFPSVYTWGPRLYFLTLISA